MPYPALWVSPAELPAPPEALGTLSCSSPVCRWNPGGVPQLPPWGAASAAALSQRLQQYLFLQRLGAIKLSFLFLYLLWPRHRGNLELREEGLAVLCCWEAFGQPLSCPWEHRESSGLGESCSERTEGSGSTAKLMISWQK